MWHETLDYNAMLLIRNTEDECKDVVSIFCNVYYSKNERGEEWVQCIMCKISVYCKCHKYSQICLKGLPAGHYITFSKNSSLWLNWDLEYRIYIFKKKSKH